MSETVLGKYRMGTAAQHTWQSRSESTRPDRPMLDDCAKESVTPSWNLGCGSTRPFPPWQNDRPSPKWPDFLCFLADSVQNTILNALEEVENALVAYTRERDRYEALPEAVSSNKGAMTLANVGPQRPPQRPRRATQFVPERERAIAKRGPNRGQLRRAIQGPSPDYS